MAHQQRGLSEHHERFHAHYVRDTRTVSVRMADFLKNPHYVGCLLLVFAVTTYFMSYFADVIGILGIVSFLICFYQKSKLPFRLPMHSGMKDYNDVTPGKKEKARDARGIYYFGNEIKTSDELWFSNEDMRTHVLIFGSTGSGKTQALISLAYNALLQASGFIYVDGKGDNTLFAKVFSMVRYMGREDDLLLINFMTGARDIIGPQEKRLSNTMNPFAFGSSSMLSQLIISLMEESSKSSDSDMWKGRAISFVEALMKVLVAMRDAGHILIDANTIRNYFHLPRLEAMVLDNTFIRDGQESINMSFLPDTIREPIKNYVLNLPGFNADKKGKQVSQVFEQHGYITMQLTRVFTSLADTYGHIMRTKLAEVDLKDVVLNRRILAVLLPALEKSPVELANLGKVIVASLRVMMAAGLGDAVEGEYADLVSSKPTNAATPYLCILDEYGYYAVEGFAVVPAQARSLGFSVVFSGQDLPAFQKASKEEAASIGANTNIKICMKLEDPMETWEFFMKTAGESYVTHVGGFQTDTKSISGQYQDSRSASSEKRARIDLQDLKNQREGEAHMFFKSKIVRYRTFYANPPAVKTLRVNHFVKVDSPDDAEVAKLSKHLRDFEKRMKDHSLAIDFNVGEEEVTQMVKILNEHPDQDLISRSVTALQEFNKAHDLVADFFAEESSDFAKPDYLNIFTGMQHAEYLKGIVITNNMRVFEQPMLDRGIVRDQIEYMERLCGKNGPQATNVSIELLRDMQSGTEYPPKVDLPKKSDVLANDVNLLVAAIEKRKTEVKLEKKTDEKK